MLYLGIETSSNIGSVALSEDDKILDEISFEKGLVHGRELVPNIQKILSKNKLTASNLELICVSIGPGSYTGLRIGLASAKIFAYALKKSLLGVPTLDVLSMNAPLEYDYACPVIDARWEQIYFCVYKKTRKGWSRKGDYSVLQANDVADKIPENAFVFGDALKKYLDLFRKKGKYILGTAQELWFPRAGNVCLKGYEIFKKGKRDDIYKLEPLYLRPGIS